MKEYILLIRLPVGYGPEQAQEVRPLWTALTGEWKAGGIFVASYIFPGEGHVIPGNRETADGEMIAGPLRIISSIIVRASDFEEALLLAKKCPILQQGGTVEVREVQPVLPV